MIWLKLKDQCSFLSQLRARGILSFELDSDHLSFFELLELYSSLIEWQLHFWLYDGCHFFRINLDLGLVIVEFWFAWAISWPTTMPNAHPATAFIRTLSTFARLVLIIAWKWISCRWLLFRDAYDDEKYVVWSVLAIWHFAIGFKFFN